MAQSVQSVPIPPGSICQVVNLLLSTTFENDSFCFDIQFSDSLNRGQQLPAPYKRLIDEIKQK